MDEDARLHSTFEFSSPSRSSSIGHAVKGAISQVQLYPEIRPAFHHK